MDTHRDASHISKLRDEFMEKLQGRAEDDRTNGRSKITGGADGEEILAEWKARARDSPHLNRWRR